MNLHFELDIKLGNEAMSSPDDVSKALQLVSIKLERGQREGPILDLNGNKVGKFGLYNEKD